MCSLLCNQVCEMYATISYTPKSKENYNLSLYDKNIMFQEKYSSVEYSILSLLLVLSTSAKL